MIFYYYTSAKKGWFISASSSNILFNSFCISSFFSSLFSFLFSLFLFNILLNFGAGLALKGTGGIKSSVSFTKTDLKLYLFVYSFFYYMNGLKIHSFLLLEYNLIDYSYFDYHNL